MRDGTRFAIPPDVRQRNEGERDDGSIREGAAHSPDADLEAAAREIAKKHGVDLSAKRGTYGDRLEVRLTFGTVDTETGLVDTPEARTLAKYGALYEADPTWLGKSFRDGRGIVHTVTGLNTRKSKRPLLTTGSDGRNYSWPPATARIYLAAGEAK